MSRDYARQLVRYTDDATYLMNQLAKVGKVGGNDTVLFHELIKIMPGIS